MEIPGVVHLGIPLKNAIPKINYPPVEIYRMSEAVYSHAIEKRKINGVEMHIFSPEKRWRIVLNIDGDLGSIWPSKG